VVEEEVVTMLEAVLVDMVEASGDIKPFRRHFTLTGTMVSELSCVVMFAFNEIVLTDQ
jgi:hypothetical protein